MAWQILAEAGAHGTGAAVQSCHFAPDGAYTRLDVWLLWHGLACLCLEYINTAFANIELAVLLLTAAVDLKSLSRTTISVTSTGKGCWDALVAGRRSLRITRAHTQSTGAALPSRWLDLRVDFSSHVCSR